jgi:ureidoglycolate hydrolase
MSVSVLSVSSRIARVSLASSSSSRGVGAVPRTRARVDGTSRFRGHATVETIASSSRAGASGRTSLVAEPLTSLGFAPFGQVAFPEEDGAAFGPEDAQLDLSRGTPRFYLMRLRDKHMEFDTITYHEQCTQCLGALGSESWYMAVSQATHDVTQYPVGESIKVFEIPPGVFVKMHAGTWHAGPLWDSAAGPNAMDFYNLELSDTNQVDHNCHEYGTGDGFEVVGSSVML